MKASSVKNGLGIELQSVELFDSLINSIDKRIGGASPEDFSDYRLDPVAWCRDILSESFPPEVEKLMASVVENEVTVAQSCNAYGKSFAASRMALWWLQCLPNSQVFITAAPPETNIRRILWSHIMSVVQGHPNLFKGFRVIDLHIERSPISFLTAVTIPMTGSEAVQEAKASGKHAENLMWIGDEADGIPEPVYKGIEGCSSGGLSRQLYMFNPRAEVGAVYRMIRDRRAAVVHLNAFTHPNVVTGKDLFPGAVTREKTARRINEWCRPLADGERSDSECFELPDFMAGTVARSQGGKEYPPLKPGFYKITDTPFSYMVLGQYPAKGSNQLISREWINQARSRWDAYVAVNGEVPPELASAIMGLDVAEFGDDSNVACFRYGGFVEQLVSWGDVDIIQTGDRAASEFKKRKAHVVNVDATGIGAGVAPHMRRSGCPAYPIKGASKPTTKTELGEFNILRDQLWWACREWLRTDPGAMVPPDEFLIEELLTPSYEVEGGRIRVMKKSTMRELLKRSPDRADALCLTFNDSGFFAGCDLT